MNTTHTRMNQIIRGTQKNPTSMDAHCWIEHKGRVIDYEDKELASVSAYGNKNVVRKEFSEELQKKLQPIIRKIYKHHLEQIRFLIDSPLFCDFTWEGWTQRKQKVGYCVFKTLDYKRQNPDAIIKIGSLGFVQSNGDIFYEYG